MESLKRRLAEVKVEDGRPKKKQKIEEEKEPVAASSNKVDRRAKWAQLNKAKRAKTNKDHWMRNKEEINAKRRLKYQEKKKKENICYLCTDVTNEKCTGCKTVNVCPSCTPALVHTHDKEFLLEQTWQRICDVASQL